MQQEKKVKCSENLSELFREADNIFDNKRTGTDEDLPEITIPNTQTMFKELNDRKVPEELNFFSGGTNGGNELRFHALQNIGMLNEINEHFLEHFFIYHQILLAKFYQKLK